MEVDKPNRKYGSKPKAIQTYIRNAKGYTIDENDEKAMVGLLLTETQFNDLKKRKYVHKILQKNKVGL